VACRLPDTRRISLVTALRIGEFGEREVVEKEFADREVGKRELGEQ